jgi:hypothetical protein
MGQQFDWEALLATLTLPAPTSRLFRLFYVIQGALATETLGEAGQTLGAGDALLLPATIAWAAGHIPAGIANMLLG